MNNHKSVWKSYSLYAFLIALAIAAIMLLSCGTKETDSADQQQEQEAKLSVYVVNYPVMYFAERIGGDKIDVQFPAPADEDPAFWMPAPEVIKQYQDADVIFLNGATYAKWIDKVTLPQTKLVNTSESFKDRYLLMPFTVKHSHGPGGEHAHTGTDFNTWMNPLYAVEQARAIKTKLQHLLPADSGLFEANFAALESDLIALDLAFTDLTAGKGKIPLFASHPVYGYFAERYGLNLKCRLWEPEEMPGVQQWKDFDHERDHHAAKWMIWEGDPDAAIVVKLKESGIACAVVYPCGNKPDAGDYLSVMKQNVERLRPVFE